MKGKLIIISSPSGGGKGTLIKEVRGLLPEVGYSVSHTTRKIRFGEENGREYFFVTREDFERRIGGGDFLEYAGVHGNLYGTSITESEKVFRTGKDLIVEVDVQGALQIMERRPDDNISIFILPPSFEVLRARLISRGTEDNVGLQIRLKNAFGEVMNYSRFKYVVINDNLAAATRQIAAIILAERQLLDRQNEAIRGILDSFDASKHHFAGEDAKI
jgi:guanylate kinase